VRRGNLAGGHERSQRSRSGGVFERTPAFPANLANVAQVMDRHRTVAHPDLDAILAADQWRARKRPPPSGKNIQ